MQALSFVNRVEVTPASKKKKPLNSWLDDPMKIEDDKVLEIKSGMDLSKQTRM